MTNQSGTSPAPVDADDRAWDLHDVAAYLKTSPETVKNLVQEDPDFPQPVPISKRLVRWHPQVVRDWLRAGTERNLPVRATSSGRRLVERV